MKSVIRLCRAAATSFVIASASAAVAADADAFAQRLAVRHVPVPAWLVGEAPDWIDPEAPPPDLPWKDLERAPAWSSFVRTNAAPLRTAARFRDAELLPLLRREAGFPLPDGTPLRADAESFADRLFAAAWEDDSRIYDRLVRDLGPEADRIEAAGFTNPVVSFVRTAVRSRREKDPWPEAGRASPAFSELLRVGAVYQTRQPADLEAELVRAAAAWCGSLAARPEDSRAAWRFLAFLFRFRDAAPPGLADALDAAGADPWLGHLVRAYGAKALAWKARGGGYAPTVKPEGWRGFHERLSDAWREALEAFRLHPEFPEAARLLLDVHGAAGGGPGNAAEDLWFARALEAEIDEPQTYRDYLWYVCYPRWGGSVADMKRFARACHATHRHDTMIPEQYANAMGCAAQETGTPRDAFFAEGKAFKRLVEVYSALSTNADARVELRWKAQARLPVFFWRNALVPLAIEANLRKEPGADVQLDTPDLQECGRLLDLLCGEHGDALVPFESWWRTAFPSFSLVPSLRALLDRTDWTPRERAHLLLRENQLRLQFPDAFDPGAWTEIPFDETFSLFAGAPAARFDAPWWAEPTGSETTLRPIFDLPADYELEGVVQPTDRRTWSCRIELGPPKAPGPPVSVGGDTAVVWTPPVPPTVGWGLWPFLGTNACFVSFGADLYREARESVVDWFPPTDGEIPFRVVVRGNAVSLWLASREIFRDRECTAPPLAATRTCCSVSLALANARVCSLRFRAARPEWADGLERWSECMRERAAGTNAEARADYIENELLPFWRRELVEPFLAGPEGTNAWAPRAAELMERELRFLADGSVADCSGTPGEGDARDRSDLIGFVERADTKNPFLLFLRAAAVREKLLREKPPAKSDYEWAAVSTREAFALQQWLDQDGGDPLGRLLASGLLMRDQTWNRDRSRTAAKRAAEWLAARKPAPDEERAARWLLVDLFAKDADVAELADALDAAGDAVPWWIRHLTRGQERLAEARDQARWASSERVRLDGREGAGAEQAAKSVAAAKQAREALETAWTAHRGRDAISAGLMVEVAALEGADDALTWLRRATEEGEPDNTLAYGKYEWNVARPNRRMPGGGGSREHQRAFAAACGAAGMDASVPGFFFLRASLQDVAESGSTFEDLLERDPALFARLERIAAAVRDNVRLDADPRRYAGRAAATLALARGDLRAAADAQKKRPGRGTFYFDDANWPRSGETEFVLAGIGGAHSDALVDLLEKDRAGDAAGVIAAGDALLAVPGGLDPAETALAVRLADARRFERDFASGAWCPVRFSAGGVLVNALNAPSFSASKGVGPWRAGDGWIQQPGGNGPVLRLQWPVPEELELRCVAEWSEAKLETYRGNRNVGPQPVANFAVRLDRADAPMKTDRYAPLNVGLQDDTHLYVSFGGARRIDQWSSRGGSAQHKLPRETRFTPLRVRFRGDRVEVRVGEGDAARTVSGPSWTPRDPGPDGLRLTFDGCDYVRIRGLQLRNPAVPEPAAAEEEDGGTAAAAWPPAEWLGGRPGEKPQTSFDPALDPLGLVENARTNGPVRAWREWVDSSFVPLLREETRVAFPRQSYDAAPWAAEARAEIERAIELAWYDRLTRRPAWEWEPAVRLVLENGETDPFLRWMAIMGLIEQGRKDEAREQLRRLEELAAAGPDAVPLFVRFLSAVAAWRLGGNNREALARGVDWAASRRPFDSRAVLRVLREIFEGKDLAPALEAAAAAGRVDPWLALCARGFEENAVAANAIWRRPGPDNDPLEYARRFRAASDAFERAWELHPQWPEPARGMLDGWSSRLSPAEREVWLLRGLAAEGDDRDLLERHFAQTLDAACADGSRDRGALKAALGRALVRTERFDTRLPFLGAVLLNETGGRSDEDYALLCRVAAEMSARPAGTWWERDSVQGWTAARAYERRDPDLRIDFSRPMRHALHKEGPYYGWCRYLQNAGEPQAVVQGLGGRSAEKIAEVERAFRAGDADLVRETAEALLRDPPFPLVASETELLARRLDDAWLATAATNGGWKALPFGVPDGGGHWSFVNNGARGKSGDALFFREAFGRSGPNAARWSARAPVDLEVRADLAPLPGSDETGVVDVRLDVDGARNGESAVATFFLRPGAVAPSVRSAHEFVERNWKLDPPPADDPAWLPVEGDGPVPVRVRWRDGVVSVWIGGADTPALETAACRAGLLPFAGGKATLQIGGGFASVSDVAVRTRSPAEESHAESAESESHAESAESAEK